MTFEGPRDDQCSYFAEDPPRHPSRRRRNAPEASFSSFRRYAVSSLNWGKSNHDFPKYLFACRYRGLLRQNRPGPAFGPGCRRQCFVQEQWRAVDKGLRYLASRRCQPGNFVPVDLAHLQSAIARDDFEVSPISRDVDARLRPSIETLLHALLPHAVVAHLHEINALVHLVQKTAKCCCKNDWAILVNGCWWTITSLAPRWLSLWRVS